MWYNHSTEDFIHEIRLLKNPTFIHSFFWQIVTQHLKNNIKYTGKKVEELKNYQTEVKLSIK